MSNVSSTNYLEQPRGYRLLPTKRPPCSTESRLAKRVACTIRSLHVTKFREGELDAVGRYPCEDEKDTGLAVFAAHDEKIVDEDVVVWHIFGFVHSPLPEHVPVMDREDIWASPWPRTTSSTRTLASTERGRRAPLASQHGAAATTSFTDNHISVRSLFSKVIDF